MWFALIACVFGLRSSGQGKTAHQGDQLDPYERSIPPFRQVTGQLGRRGQLEAGRQGRYHVGHGNSSSVVSRCGLPARSRRDRSTDVLLP
jgi:hypothetical protein